MMVFTPLVVVLIGQFCCDVIGCQDLKVENTLLLKHAIDRKSNSLQ